MKTILLLALMAGAVFGAPSTPITRGRLTTDLDAAGHSITNGPMATTNFVWEVVGSVTNNLPSGTDGETMTNIVEGVVTKVYVENLGISAGLTTNDVRAIVEANAGPTNRIVHTNPEGYVNPLTVQSEDFGGDINRATYRGGLIEWVADGHADVHRLSFPRGSGYIALASDIPDVPSIDLPPLSSSATVGDLVDAVNAIAGALRKDDEP